MNKSVLMDQFHLTIYAPHALSKPEFNAISHALHETRFLTALRRALRNVFRRHPALAQVRVKLSR